MKSRAAISPPLPGDPGALIFAWERPRRRVLRLAVLLALSFLGHAITFYVLQVAYTPTATLLPPPAEVMMLPPDSEENKALDRWLTFADPALMAQSTGPTTAQTLAELHLRYAPSYVAAPPAFKPLNPPTDEDVPPRVPIFGPAPTPPLSEAVMADVRRVPANAPSLLRFDGGLADLAPHPLPAIDFNIKAAVGKGLRALEPTVYLVGVPAGGGSPFLFLEASCAGNAAADESTRAADDYARDYLVKLSFPPPPDPANPPWGRATFYWGKEAYR